MGQYQHVLHGLTFPDDWDKVRQPEIRKLKPPVLRKMRKHH